MVRRTLLVLGCLVFAGPAVLAQSTISEKQTAVQETTVGTIEEEAQRWQLTTDEYSRYLEALEGPRGRLSDPSITPIEVLGIEATSTAERDHYARLWVEMIRRDTAKTLAFTRSVHAAWLDIAPNRSLIDPLLLKKLKLQRERTSVASEDVVPSRLIAFTRLDCEACDSDLRRLILGVEEGRHLGLDIFVVDAGDDADLVQAWAQEQSLPLERVQDQTITLNIDRGELLSLAESLGISSETLPMVIRRTEDGYAVADRY